MTNTATGGFRGSIAVGLLLALSTSGAMANWNFENATVSNGTATASFNNVTATASAFSVTNATVNTGGQTIGKFNSGQAFASATLSVWQGDGLGVASGGESGSPNHSVDNKDRTDMVLFGFSSKVELDAVTIGWAQTSSYQCGGTTQNPVMCAADATPDISLLYYTGTSAAPTVNGKTWTDLLTDGWKLVDNYADLTVNTAKSVNAPNYSSSWWMVSAFNTGFGGNANGATINDDYFKLASLAGVVPTTTPPGKVPEPGSLALIGAALIGLLGARRRAAAKR